MTVKITDTTMRDFRLLFGAGVLLLLVAFLPWQERTVDIRVQDPVPILFPQKAELERETSEAETGNIYIPGYEVRKATPFGDGILVGALGGVVAILSLVALRRGRRLTLAIPTIAGAALIALLVGLYDAFTYGLLDDWSLRDWHVSWGKDSFVRIETTPTFGMFIILVVAAYLTWRSLSMIGMSETWGPPGSGSNLPSDPGPI